MRKNEKKFLAYIQALPASARQDLLRFIESSAKMTITDEGAYLRDVMELHSVRRGTAPCGGASQRGDERPC